MQAALCSVQSLLVVVSHEIATSMLQFVEQINNHNISVFNAFTQSYAMIADVAIGINEKSIVCRFLPSS